MRQISDTQPIMEKLFPNLLDYPMNVFIASLGQQIDGKPIISLLSIVDDTKINKIKSASEHVQIELSTFTEENHNGYGKDFFLRLSFLLSSGKIEIDAEISANDPMRQKDFLQSLQKVDEINIWFANSERKVEKVIAIDFDSQDAYPAISAILNDIGVSH